MAQRSAVTDQMVDRLPVWARNERMRLVREVQQLREQLAALSQPDSRVVAHPVALAGDPQPVGLGNHASVRFTVGPRRDDAVDISLRSSRNDDPDTRLLYVSAYSGALALVPRSSNVVEISLVDLHKGVQA